MYAVCGEVISKTFHLFVIGTMQVYVRDWVEPDEVNATEQPLQQPNYRTGVFFRVVNALKHDIFERQPALV